MITSGKFKTQLKHSNLCAAERKCRTFLLDDNMTCVLDSLGCESDLADLAVDAGQVFLHEV